MKLPRILSGVFFFFAISAGALAAQAADKLHIVATLPDLKSIADALGGDRVETFAIATGYQNPHFVDPKPSYILKLSKADIFITVGLDLETGWVPPLLNSARNSRIMMGGEGYIDASLNVPLLQVPSSINRAEGDIHIYGNPHYWLDPENGLRIARGIQRKLAEMRPADAAYFEQRYQSFSQRLQQENKKWDELEKLFRGRKVVTYHRSWPNFTKRFGLDVVGYVEPRPGIPPSPAHTVDLIQMMKRENVKVILVEPYFDLKTPNAVARETGAQVVVLLPSVGGEKEVTDYFKLFDYDVGLLVQAFRAAR